MNAQPLPQSLIHIETLHLHLPPPTKKVLPASDAAELFELPAAPAGTSYIPGTSLLRLHNAYGNKLVAHTELRSAVQTLTQLPGFTPWRAAEIWEALKIVNYKHFNPAVDPANDPDIGPYDYWTNTTSASCPEDVAWNVCFGNGNSWRRNRHDRARVLAVCSPASQK